MVLVFYLCATYVWSGSEHEQSKFAGLYVEVVDSSKSKTQFLSAAEIRAAVYRNIPMPSDSLLSHIDTDSIESLLLQNRLISRVNCYTTPSGLLRIDVWQRIPILRVEDGAKTFFVDENGEIIPGRMPVPVRVPIATGSISKDFATGELYDFAGYLTESDFWHAQVEQICVSPEEEVSIIPRVGNHCIILGSMSDYKEKLNNLRCFYDQALSKCGWNKYHTINLKYKNQVVATKRK